MEAQRVTRGERWAMRLGIALGFVVVLCSSCKSQDAAVRRPHMLSAVLYVQKLDKAPDPYRGWYADAERCTGLRGDFDKVKWYTTPHPWGDTTWAMWQEPHRITVNAEDALDSAVVLHESIHDILSYAHVYEQGEVHPAMWYGPGKCAFKFYHHN